MSAFAELLWTHSASVALAHIAAQFVVKAPLVKSTLTKTRAVVILNRT